ncbi:MAG TPA: S41 family peptidase [Burkholderiales bacterium]|nr:S41 family peptidase [Burkholderiales bacterium]
MRRRLGRFRAIAAACLVAAAGSCSAAASSLTDEMLAPLAAAYLRAVAPGEKAERHRELLGAVLRQVERGYAREVNAPALIAAARKALEPLAPGSGEPEAVFARAVNAALGSLDPHSRYLDPRAAAALRSAMRSSFGGLGLQLEMVDGLLRVVAPLPGTPAARAGLRSGDLIVRLDDQPVEGMTLEEALSRMRGEPGTPIALTIRRSGQEEPLVVSLVREPIRQETVRWSMEAGVLVLRISSFAAAVSAQIEQAAAEAAAEGAPRAIVLDLRGNTGGLLRQAVMTADAFLSGGQIVSLQGRSAASRRSWRADASEHFAGVPMVVLIDGRTASAAELVAAALQENGRATVMGQRSFGKGSVQSLISLGEGKGALRLTTAFYHGPSGRTVERTGVGPDVELVYADGSGTGSRRREAAQGHALPGAGEPVPPKARLEASRCALARQDLDPALACALAFVQAGGIEAFVEAFEAAWVEASER